ncbi:unnamed protein product [Parajaminaea phylloscopi]
MNQLTRQLPLIGGRSFAAPLVVRSPASRPISTAVLGRVERGSSTSHCSSPPLAAFGSPAQIRLKSKKSRASLASNVDEPRVGDGDVPVMKTKGKGANATKSGARGAKSKRGNREQDEVEDDSSYKTSTKNEDLPGESYNEDTIKSNLKRSVERCKQTVMQMVGMHGRADPALLDPVKVEYSDGDGGAQRYPLSEFAAVGTRDGDLIVNIYDETMLKQVERAIYMADLGLTPQHVPNAEGGVLRIPIPRPTAETRNQLLKDINRVCENARVSIRSARHEGQKLIKRDVDNKVIGSSEGQKEQKSLDELVKTWQKEVEDFYNDHKKKIEKERDS